ncbi:hypothetical protein [Tropicibacter naphthalenivorans]|uniref:Histidinol phosphate aminotransferase n=1 Tax=Tropicibacter naphthalenivorans TaxID=441103 RepID=A0A0P1GIZ1_9RHOB|nr:hypothetical protein [Tropicibacter naphthalenivorans]CUH81477.1 hypothetical protein TRN7648_03489 [Tropicibacter naphthalenivorans]SMD00222.1 hypothetical protein SAMN04488093_109101 [Tropicibacter naphthalenivorans]
MKNHHPTAVEDFTTTNLVLLFVNLTWIMAAISAAWGFASALVVAALLNHAITRLDFALRRKTAQQAAQARTD